MRKITRATVALFFFSLLLNAQQMPIDFSDNADVFVAFGGSSFSVEADPDDASNPVGQLANNGFDIWEGFFLDLNVPVNLDENKIVTLSFYQFDSNSHNIIVKLENGPNEDVEVLVSTSGAGWKRDLEFDFSNATISGTSTGINATGAYSRLTVFVDGGSNASGTFLIDDINDGSEPSDPNELDVIYDELVWSDEFETDGPINDANWFHQTQLPAGGSWFNGEVQHYTNRIENSFVENGFLNIVAIKEVFTDQGERKDYTSARLNSKFAFTYGRVDVRAQLPVGDGTWPAIWTLGKNINELGAYWETQGFGEVSWPACGELDIMEHGLHSTNEVSVAIHTPSSFGNTVNTAIRALPDVANNFYVYSMNWSPNEIAFMIDDQVIYRYNPSVKDDQTWPFDKDQYMILNIAMGGFAGTIDPNFTQSSMLIDYVRVYQGSSLSNDSFDLESLSIYPNPVSERLHLKGNIRVEKAQIYTMLGQLVLRNQNVENGIDVSILPDGIYVLDLITESGSKSLKFIKTSI